MKTIKLTSLSVILWSRKKEAEIQKEHKELESYKRDLNREKRELEEELQIQRSELNTGKMGRAVVDVGLFTLSAAMLDFSDWRLFQLYAPAKGILSLASHYKHC